MYIKEALIKEHSKKTTIAIVKYIGSDKDRFKELLDLFLNSEYRLNQRAAWPLSYVSIQQPKLIDPHIGKLIKNLNKQGNHDAVIRNTLRIFREIDIPEKYCSELFDICLGYSKNATLPFAIRVFAIYTMGNICKKYPELKPELELIISELKSFPQPASLSSCIRNVSKILLKL